MNWTKVVAYIGAAAWVPHIYKWVKNAKKNIRADSAQAAATVVLAGIALVTLIYGIVQYESYKSEKRPYVSLITVDIGSNLCRDYTISCPGLESGKEVFPAEIIAADKETQGKVEEIIVNLCYKNTGPIAAKDVRIFTGLVAGDSYKTNGEKNPDSRINDNTIFDVARPKNYINQETIKLVALMPEQEKRTLFMFHRKEKDEEHNIMRRDSTTTNPLYLICDIQYNSINGRKHGYFGVYKLYHLPAYTRIYNADLIESKVY